MTDTNDKKTLWDAVTEKLREWRDALDDALTPPPELVPVPVKNRPRR